MESDRYILGTNPISREQLEVSIKIGILTTEKQIMDYQYLSTAKVYKESKGYTEGKYIIEGRKASDYSDEIWQGLSVEDYCKKYPVKFNPDKGRWDNV